MVGGQWVREQGSWRELATVAICPLLVVASRRLRSRHAHSGPGTLQQACRTCATATLTQSRDPAKVCRADQRRRGRQKGRHLATHPLVAAQPDPAPVAPASAPAAATTAVTSAAAESVVVPASVPVLATVPAPMPVVPVPDEEADDGGATQAWTATPTATRHCPQCRAPTLEKLCPVDGTTTFALRGVDVARVMQLAPGAVIAGRYRITARLGKGGFGAVYEAQHTASGQPVALKLLALDPDDAGEETYFRFFQEARVTAGLRHPNTVRLYDFGQDDDGVLYMAMEVLRGPTLEKHLKTLRKSNEAMTELQTVGLGVQILKSLQEAHGVGLVHRDLKPDNIILHDVGEDEPVVKVLDFGIARQRDSGMTQGARLMGTPMYMSPEQCYGATDLDARSDLYSLAVILYRCVTGVPPFTGDMFGLLHAHMHDPPPDLRAAAKVPLSASFVRALECALAKEPQERFATSRLMREALEQAVGGVGTPISMNVRRQPSGEASLDGATLGATAAATMGATGAETVALTPATVVQPPKTSAEPATAPTANRWLLIGLTAVCVALAVVVAVVVATRPEAAPASSATVTPVAATAPAVAPAAPTAAVTAPPSAPAAVAAPALAPAPVPSAALVPPVTPEPATAALAAKPKPKPAKPSGAAAKPAADGKPTIQFMD